MESQKHEAERDERPEESPEEFARDIESDPARNPESDELDDVKGG